MRHYQIAGTSCQAFCTVLGSKDLPSDTIGKLMGMVKIKKIGIIRSQVLRKSAKISMDAVQRLNVGGPSKEGIR